MWQWAIRPLTTIERSPSEIRKSCSESSCSANGVSICAPPRLTSRIVIGWNTLTSPLSGEGTGTRSVSRLFSSDMGPARLYTKPPTSYAKLPFLHTLERLLRYLIFGILYTVVYLGAGALLGGYPLGRMIVANALLLVLAGSVCVVVLRRRREWEGTHRLFWDAFAAGMAMWCIGQIGFTISSLSDH